MDKAAQVLERMKGPVVPINVCFNVDGTINYDAVGAYVNWLCEEHTLYFCSLTGAANLRASAMKNSGN